MKLSDFRTDFYSVLKRSKDSFPELLANMCINAGIRQIANIHTFDEMVSEETESLTVAGGAQYDYNPLIKEVNKVIIIDGKSTIPLTFVNSSNMTDEYGHRSISSPGLPRVFTSKGLKYEVAPLPNATYALYMDCSLYPAVLAADVDVPTLLNKDGMILAASLIFGFSIIRDEASYSIVNIQKKVWEDAFATLIAPYLSIKRDASWMPIIGGGNVEPFRGEYWKRFNFNK